MEGSSGQFLDLVQNERNGEPAAYGDDVGDEFGVVGNAAVVVLYAAATIAFRAVRGVHVRVHWHCRR